MLSPNAFYSAADGLIDLLLQYGPGNDVVANPWVDEVPGLDRPGGASQRVKNLRAYVGMHRDAKWMLVGQEAGYAGCRFSGIPFTSEDMLEGATVHPVFLGKGLHRTSSFAKPSSERSAKIVWPVIGTECTAVLWTSLPFHCHDAGKPLTNRAWKPADDRNGLAETILRHGVEKLFSGIRIVAVGRKSEETLRSFGYEAIPVRHPSQGGATIFRGQMAEILGKPA